MVMPDICGKLIKALEQKALVEPIDVTFETELQESAIVRRDPLPPKCVRGEIYHFTRATSAITFENKEPAPDILGDKQPVESINSLYLLAAPVNEAVQP